MAISYWLWLFIGTDFVCERLFGFRKTLVESTMEKRDCLSSLLEQKHISLFYCNSHKAILNPHQHRSETIFCQKLLVEMVYRLILRNGSLSTPKNASPKMPLDIFDVPASRSTKIIDSSAILKPYFHAVYFISIWNP